MKTVKERVAAGARLLDEREPGWRARVNPVTLNIASPCDCVLGQLYQFFYYGARRVLFPGTETGKAMSQKELEVAEDLGFTSSCGEWAELDAAWLEELAKTGGEG